MEERIGGYRGGVAGWREGISALVDVRQTRRGGESVEWPSLKSGWD